MDVIVNVVNQKLKIASNLKNYVEGSKISFDLYSIFQMIGMGLPSQHNLFKKVSHIR